MARYVRLKADPEAAEAAITVADDSQRRGLGTALLIRLAERARAEGIHHLTAAVLSEKRRVIEQFKVLGAPATDQRKRAARSG